VWLNKTGQLPDDEGNERMEWGLLLEVVIAAEFQKRMGLEVRCKPDLLRAVADNPICRATLDGLVYDGPGSSDHDPLGLLELKNTSFSDWDEIPDHYLLQVQWQLGVTELERGWIAVLHRGNRLAIHEITADPALYSDLVDVAERFWSDHVMTGRPPAVDGMPATTSAIKAAWAVASGAGFELSMTALNACRHLEQAKEAQKVAEVEVARWENEIKVELGDAEAGLYGDLPVVTWRTQSRTSLDVKQLEAEMPDVAAKFRRESTHRVLRINHKTLEGALAWGT
jgi:predicted phage-related endonuclease